MWSWIQWSDTPNQYHQFLKCHNIWWSAMRKAILSGFRPQYSLLILTWRQCWYWAIIRAWLIYEKVLACSSYGTRIFSTGMPNYIRSFKSYIRYLVCHQGNTDKLHHSYKDCLVTSCVVTNLYTCGFWRKWVCRATCPDGLQWWTPVRTGRRSSSCLLCDATSLSEEGKHWFMQQSLRAVNATSQHVVLLSPV